MCRNKYSVRGIWGGGTKDAGSNNLFSVGYNALGRALRVSKPKRTQIPKREGDEPKSAMEMRKAGCSRDQIDQRISVKNQKRAAIA